MTQYVPGPIATRKVAILVAEGFDAAGVAALVKALAAAKAPAAVSSGRDSAPCAATTARHPSRSSRS